MHELALMQSLVATVEEEVPRARVFAVRVEIGELAAVVPDALQLGFELCAQGTRLEGAVLEVCAVPAAVRCRACGDERDGAPWAAPCACGCADADLVRGDEIRLVHVELSEEEAA